MKACLFKIILNWCNIFKVSTLGGVLLTLLGGVSCNSEVWGLEGLAGSGTWLTDAVVARLAHVRQTVGRWKLLFFPDSRRNTCLFASQNFRQILFRGFSNWQVLVYVFSRGFLEQSLCFACTNISSAYRSEFAFVMVVNSLWILPIFDDGDAAQVKLFG